MCFRKINYFFFLKIITNPLIISSALGILFNLTGIELYEPVMTAVDMIHRHGGQLDEAREHLERSIAEFREIGDMYYAHIVTGTLADLERVRGNFDDAEALYDRAESFLFVAVAPPPSVAVNRALLELMRGRFAAARVRAAGARTGTEREPAPNILLALLAIEACLAAHDEDFETWRELMDRMPPLADAINVVEYDFVWAYDQSLREGAGRFPDDAVLERLEIAARFWRRLSRSAEAESIAELARRL